MSLLSFFFFFVRITPYERSFSFRFQSWTAYASNIRGTEDMFSISQCSAEYSGGISHRILCRSSMRKGLPPLGLLNFSSHLGNFQEPALRLSPGHDFLKVHRMTFCFQLWEAQLSHAPNTLVYTRVSTPCLHRASAQDPEGLACYPLKSSLPIVLRAFHERMY